MIEDCLKPQQARVRLMVHGVVQGIGFRPFVYRLARSLSLSGWVTNSAKGVVIEVEGSSDNLQTFQLRLESEKPDRSFIQSLESTWLPSAGYTDFQIRESQEGGVPETLILPDIGTCPDCLRELLDPNDRRYRYPFINCTNCGPRFSIIEALPYDRHRTSMHDFDMCDACAAEYADPENRRFHAQPNACWECGPQVQVLDASGEVMIQKEGEHPSGQESVVKTVATAIADGAIVAVKGLGGFHLMVRCDDAAAVCRLRERKHREAKPLALMFPSVEQVERVCELNALEKRVLCSAEAPIVLLKRRTEPLEDAFPICHHVAPGNPYLGVMLPSNPLHHLLIRELGIPVIATSANLSDEPICIDNQEAVERLSGVADLFLVHDRPIVRHVDDSIVRVVLGREMLLRRARGYAPLPISWSSEKVRDKQVLAVGGHLKNSVAISTDQHIFISQHIGDLETEVAYTTFQKVARDLTQLYDVKIGTVVHDRHPDYLSTKWSEKNETPTQGVQHHVAHVLSCMAENELRPPLLGVSWDGTGYGLDGTVWGGEFFLMKEGRAIRVGHLVPFRLLGGEAAVKEPLRSAMGLLFECFGKQVMERDDLPLVTHLTDGQRRNWGRMLEEGIQAPQTSSMGRLFDGITALLGLHSGKQYEGQAAMALEFAGHQTAPDKGYPLPVDDRGCSTSPVSKWFEDPAREPFKIDWKPMLTAMLSDIQDGVPSELISARFHRSLAELIVAMAEKIGLSDVVLSGGCFQNCLLLEQVTGRLRQEGYQPYCHQRVPPNDGGIALGQVVAALGGWKDE